MSPAELRGVQPPEAVARQEFTASESIEKARPKKQSQRKGSILPN